jgi:hypothetical protein
MTCEQQQGQLGSLSLFLARQITTQRIMSQRIPLQILCSAFQEFCMSEKKILGRPTRSKRLYNQN